MNDADRIRPQMIFCATPLMFNRTEAMRYTGLSEKIFIDAEKSGAIGSYRGGRNGQIMFHRQQLEDLVDRLFYGSSVDMDFG